MQPINQIFLHKVAEFTTMALGEISEKEAQVVDLEGQLSAFVRKDATQKYAELTKQAQLAVLLKDAADALYDSDYITDNTERKEFLKKAEDPLFLARTLTKICKAAAVSVMGTPARVASSKKNTDYDPVAERAFGSSHKGYSIVDD